jgi:hypothetical protein
MLSLIVKRSPAVENAMDAAGRWLLHSGIQSTDGGVARFCELDGAGNRAVSNEITGYTASALAFLHEVTGEVVYRDAAVHTARFLTRTAWRADLGTFPFENTSPVAPAYFFDCGIIVRALLAVHRIAGDAEFLETAKAAGRGMARDFLTPGAIHPIVELPSGRPVPYEQRWSREPGCFLLKAALAWRQLGGEFEAYFETALLQALGSWESFLPAELSEEVMNRLHAFSYFLEALLFVQERPGVDAVIRQGLARATRLREAIAPGFARSDVYAQMLRVRLLAGDVDQEVARNEFDTVMSFRDFRADPRAEGGFYFGRKDGVPMPFANPVSTAFCLQAVVMYDAIKTGPTEPWLKSLY